ncbi:MAG: excinuclease ABC subunit UvrA [Proteobacteria bacterium]|jgi:excinuclease ABC subunit A|nr:excinuclease ABC subunit UvrA [Pseudomonadota bacterium]
MLDEIVIRGAKTHNLKNIDLNLPKNKLIVITGLSGSGKSSLAFDTLYAEGQRRYVESLSAYARQFLQQMNKPDVDLIEGLSPAISIEQKATSHNPRSTVGTVTEIYDYLRLLYARTGEPFCPTHKHKLQGQSISQIVDSLLDIPLNTKIAILAPVISGRKGEYLDLIANIQAQGFTKVRIDNIIYDIDATPKLDKNKKHDIEIVVDRLKINTDIKSRITDSVEVAIEHGDGKIKVLDLDTNSISIYSSKFACPDCDYSIIELEPRSFSFNNPYGACPKCDGLGQITYFDPDKIVLNKDLNLDSGAIKGWDKRNQYTYQMLTAVAKHYKFSLDTPWNNLSSKIQQVLLYGSGDTEISMTINSESGRKVSKKESFEGIVNTLERRYYETDSQYIKEELTKYQNNKICPECEGSRLKKESRCVLVGDTTLPEITTWQLHKCHNFFSSLHLIGNKEAIGEKIIREILTRVGFLIDVGLNYITLNRSADTLSGGEAQRIRLASQIGSGLTGVMYVLDEPSIGLHQRDNDRLIATLNKLRDLGNTVIVVEHDEDAIKSADFIVDIGPGAGEHGGYIIAAGTIDDILNTKDSITGQYLSGLKKIEIPKVRKEQNKGMLEVIGASGNNLKNVHLQIPIGNFVCITGVSGSGKSTLINDTLYKACSQEIYGSHDTPENFDKLVGIENFDKVINVDQSPIGRTPRSNPATYTGLFTHIRDLFTQVALSRERGYGPGRFSFNVKGGRCEACTGDGLIKVEMHFLPDIYVICDTCKGKRYNRETLEVFYKGKNIHEILEMTVFDAEKFFTHIPNIKKKLSTLIDVGIGYIRLGQSATTLSGGEAQRVKLALELSKRDTGKTLYVLDEPTTGLHFQDIELLLKVLHKFVDNGNTVVVIEHNLDVIKTADWVIDLGPEGGEGGGNIIATGTPENIVKSKVGYTGKYLTKYLKRR